MTALGHGGPQMDLLKEYSSGIGLGRILEMDGGNRAELRS